MNALSAQKVFDQQVDQRAQPRFTVALPALASFGHTRFSVSMINIAADGAMIETWTVLPDRALITISCGTTDVLATVIWQGPNRQFGVIFERSLTERELNEQIARSAALHFRRQQKWLERPRRT